MPKAGMAGFDLIVVGAYMALMVAIGLYYYRYMKRISTYYAARGRIPWTLAALSLFMTSFSALVFVMYAGMGYRLGIVAVTLCEVTPPAFLIGAYFFSKRWRRAGIITPVQFLETRYSLSVRQLVPVISIPLALIDNGMRVFSLAIFVNMGFGVSMDQSIIACGLIVGVYTLLGGLWAVTVTDVVQFIVLAAAVVVVLPLSIAKVGGITEFFSKSSQLGLFQPMGDKSWIYLLVFLWLIVLSYNYRWSLVQRYYCVKDEKSARRVGITAAILFAVVPFMWTLPAMAARLIIPGLKDVEADYSYAKLCVQILPVGMMGIVLSAMFSATMSTVSAEYNVISSVFTVDIYKRWLHKSASEKITMLVARLSTLAICLMVTLVSLEIARRGKELFQVMVDVFGVMLPPIAIPVLWGILFPKPYAKSALVAILIGLGSAICAFVVCRLKPELVVSADNKFIVYTLAGSTPALLTMLLGVFIEKPRAEVRQKVDDFFTKMRTPYKEEAIPEGEKMPSPFPIVGLSSICIGVLLAVSTFFAEGALHKGINLGMGIGLGVVGIILFLAPRLRK
jgi:SSS family transporter